MSEAREDHFGISKQRIASVIVDTESLHKNREWKYFCDVLCGIECAAFD